MSDSQDRVFQVAYLLGVGVPEVRQAISQARRHYPNETDDDLLAIATEALRRTRQRQLLEDAKRSIGRPTDASR